MEQPEAQSMMESKSAKADINAPVQLSQAELRRRLSVNVRMHRSAAKLTLKVVAVRAAMHWRHWQKIEAGQVNATLQTLVRIATALAIDPSELLQLPSSFPPAAPAAEPEA
jgi:hypothetical protein